MTHSSRSRRRCSGRRASCVMVPPSKSGSCFQTAFWIQGVADRHTLARKKERIHKQIKGKGSTWSEPKLTTHLQTAKCEHLCARGKLKFSVGLNALGPWLTLSSKSLTSCPIKGAGAHQPNCAAECKPSKKLAHVKLPDFQFAERPLRTPVL